jgi:hypothetical protein
MWDPGNVMGAVLCDWKVVQVSIRREEVNKQERQEEESRASRLIAYHTFNYGGQTHLKAKLFLSTL